MNKINRVLPFVWFSLTPILASMLVLWTVHSYDLKSYFPPIWYMAILGFVALVLCMGFAIIPTTFVAIALGYLGGWQMLPFMFLSYLMASVIGYKIGQQSDQNFWLNLINQRKKGGEVLAKIQNHSPMFIFSCRLSPVLPFGLTNVLFGIFSIKFRDFLFFGTLGMLPRTILSTWLGIEAGGLVEAFENKGEMQYYNLILVFLLLISSVLLIRFFVRK